MHGTDDRQFIGVHRQTRDVFAYTNAGNDGGDRVKLAAIFAGSVRLRVPGFVMAHPAPAEQDDARFRPPRPRRHAGLSLQNIAHRQADSAKPDFEKRTARCGMDGNHGNLWKEALREGDVDYPRLGDDVKRISRVASSAYGFALGPDMLSAKPQAAIHLHGVNGLGDFFVAVAGFAGDFAKAGFDIAVAFAGLRFL